MWKRLLGTIVDYPPLLDLARRTIEAGHRGEKNVIRIEWGDRHGSVLDLPCGTGTYAGFFPVDTYTGVDRCERYVARAKRKYPTRTFLVMDALSLRFADGRFDRLLVVGFLHHLEESEVARALAEMARVLKPGGSLLLIEDSPTRSRWNLAGRFLQSLDAGGRIREAEYYERVLPRYFAVEKSYPMRAGLWDYTVFVLKNSRTAPATS